MEIKDIFGLAELANSKAAVLLIEKISNALGTVFLPIKALLERRSVRIKTTSDIEMNDLVRRARHADEVEEIRHQRNKEQIISEACSALNPDANPQDMDNDWIENFFNRCKIVSPPEMQRIWGLILAGEANSPGSFSKYTVNLLQNIGKVEAMLFESLCQVSCYIDDELTPFVIDFQEEVYQKIGINFDTLSDLDTLGLIKFQPAFGFKREGFSETVKIRYYGESSIFRFSNNEKNSLNFGTVMFSKAGRELSSIVLQGNLCWFYDFVCKKIKAQGCSELE